MGAKDTCTALACDRLVGPKGGRGLCTKHYQRWRTHGDPEVTTHRGMWMVGRGGTAHNQWKGDAVKYRGAHARIVAARGKPDACEHCPTTGPLGPHGYQWALRHDTDVSKIITDERGRVYSGDPFDYVRLCPPCHGQYDEAGVPRNFRTSSRFWSGCGS